MNKIINYLKSYLLFFIILIIYLIAISLLYYYNLFNYKTICIINFIFIMLEFFILGFNISHKEGKKGYLNGFLISVFLVILFTVISLIIHSISFSSLIYYLSLILSSIFGGIIGVTKKVN